ncbi:MAG: IclR family transcriptional regulator [Sphingomonadales bacterium]|nr:IclR family transcriptional regulator [Sphingomonadales bacterium]
MPRHADPEADDQPPGARAVLRVLAVLTELAAQPTGMTLAALATRLDVPKPSLHRILRTLRQSGHLALDGGRFRLGPGTVALARMIGETTPPLPFPQCFAPVLDWLAAESGETVMLGVADFASGDVEYVAAVQSTQPIRFGIAVGDRRPLYSAASGQVLLAHAPADRQRDYLEQTRFTAFTPATADAARLAQILPAIRAAGAATDIDGRVPGASGIASPVFAANGHVCAALSVAGPTPRVTAGESRLTDLCRRAAERASRILGFRTVIA